jgi:hypothetical protein
VGGETGRRCSDAKLKMFAILFSALSLEQPYTAAHEISELLKDDLERKGATLQCP